MANTKLMHAAAKAPAKTTRVKGERIEEGTEHLVSEAFPGPPRGEAGARAELAAAVLADKAILDELAKY